VSRYCIDTVAYSHFKRGEPRVVSLLDRAEWIGVPAIVLGELFAGFEQGRHRLKNIGELEELLSAPVVQVVPVDRQTAEIFGKMVADLRRRGRPIPVNDIWIAATCLRTGATLITWDAHFHHFPVIGALVME